MGQGMSEKTTEDKVANGDHRTICAETTTCDDTITRSDKTVRRNMVEATATDEHWYWTTRRERIAALADEAIRLCHDADMRFAAYLFEVAREEVKPTTS